MNDSYTKKSQFQGKNLAIVAVIAIIAVGAYMVLNAPDRRNAGEKMGDAIGELDEGFGKAARQLKDRTPGEKLGDAVEDAVDDTKKATNQ